MNPEEVSAWTVAVGAASDEFGPTLVAVVLLSILAYYILKKGKPEVHGASEVDVAVLKEQYRSLDHRVTALEQKGRRTT